MLLDRQKKNYVTVYLLLINNHLKKLVIFIRFLVINGKVLQIPYSWIVHPVNKEDKPN